MELTMARFEKVDLVLTTSAPEVLVIREMKKFNQFPGPGTTLIKYKGYVSAVKNDDLTGFSRTIERLEQNYEADGEFPELDDA